MLHVMLHVFVGSGMCLDSASSVLRYRGVISASSFFHSDFLSLQNLLWVVLTFDLFVTAFKQNNRISDLSEGALPEIN